MRSDGHVQSGLLRRFYRETVRPYLGLQCEIGFCLLAGVVLELADPLILRVIIDRALGDGDRGLLLTLGLMLLIVLLFRNAFRLVNVWLYSYSGLRILFDFRRQVYDHVQNLSWSFFRGERSGDILARMTSDVDVLQRTAAHTLVKAAQDLLTILGIVMALLWLDPLLTLALLAVYPLLVFALSRINGRLRSESLRSRQALGALYDFFAERVGSIRLIQEFGRQKAEARRHVRISRPVIQSNLALSLLGAGQISLADLMTTGSFILVLVLGGLRALDGLLSLGSLVAYYTLAGRLYRPISGLIDINIDLQVARASLSRVYELVDQPPEIRESPEATAPATREGSYRIEGVGLTWPDGTPALIDLDLRIDAGQTVALVGPSGGGKSTLAAVLSRYLDPQRGRVLLDGLDLRRWRLRELRRTVGLVPQDVQVFHDTLAANLRLARPAASDPELIDALAQADLGEFLASLPEGLGTLVGQQGLRLSGGERQRLALARALLKNPLVHILDESTSALDSRTERRVLERFHARAGGRTLILIAHRLTSVTHADRIFVLSGGRLVEQGTHDELHAAGGLYRVLYDEQSRLGHHVG